jgi:predicted transcriptional regulator
MKTIRQIAEELGVSKTAVRKKLTDEVKTKFAETIGNTVYISEQGETLIKSTFTSTNANHVCEPKGNLAETVSDIVSVLKAELQAKNEQISHLQKELTEERKHSREQSDKLALLADSAQKLHAGTIQQKLTETTTTEEVAADESCSKDFEFNTIITATEENNQPPKRGFFGIFARKHKKSAP